MQFSLLSIRTEMNGKKEKRESRLTRGIISVLYNFRKSGSSSRRRVNRTVVRVEADAIATVCRVIQAKVGIAEVGWEDFERLPVRCYGGRKKNQRQGIERKSGPHFWCVQMVKG